MSADPALPWVDEVRNVEPATSMWVQVELDIANHLHAALRHNVPFPIKNADALEGVRITEIVKEQNSQFDWKQ